MSEIQRAALYARVSKDHKWDKPGLRVQDTENQLHTLREYCQRQGWKIFHEYVDRLSGKRSDNRKQFQDMMVAASRREFDVVVVWALDRFSREGIHETFEHVNKLTYYGVKFESYTEPLFRTTGPGGELMLAVSAWIAKQERVRISERTKAGLARARREGKTLGRPHKIMNRDKVRQMHAEGKSTREIAAAMKISHMTVYRIIKAA